MIYVIIYGLFSRQHSRAVTPKADKTTVSKVEIHPLKICLMLLTLSSRVQVELFSCLLIYYVLSVMEVILMMTSDSRRIVRRTR